MTEIVFKENCRFKTFSPTLQWIFECLWKVKDNAGVDTITVTSVNDSRHSTDSRHYRDEAIDIRSKNFLGLDAKRKFAARLDELLNSHLTDPEKFIVIFESEGTINEHFHVQPRKGQSFNG